MTEQYKNKLGKTLWNVADKLRGAMDANDFKDYMLGFLCYRYLSQNFVTQAKIMHRKEEMLDAEFIEYLKTWSEEEKNKEDIEAFNKLMKEKIYYTLEPKHLWQEIINMAKNGKQETKETMKNAFKALEESASGTEEGEEDFTGLFNEIDLSSAKLGKNYEEQNKKVCDVLTEIEEGIKDIYQGEKITSDILGDAYEYLIGEFAAGSGKKAGEFYTPKEISNLLARIVTMDSVEETKEKQNIKAIYDFACGSGSLLLQLSDKLKDKNEDLQIYGQEKNITTYNLARMNMLIRGKDPKNFHIWHGDTLKNDEENELENLKFDAVVANPPFSLKWQPDEMLRDDPRFRDYDIPPSSAADFAFVLHGLHYLEEGGTMAIIVPHGVLFRGSKEERIRRGLLQGNTNGYIDAVIGLPEKLFYNTGIPVAILVLKKCRKNKDILFINAAGEGKKAKRQNKLEEERIQKIADAYKNRAELERFSKKVDMEEIKENNYNLNISRYVSIQEEEKEVDIKEVAQSLKKEKEEKKEAIKELNKYLTELGLEELS